MCTYLYLMLNKQEYIKKKINDFYKKKKKEEILVQNYSDKRIFTIDRIIDNLATRARTFCKTNNINKNFTHMQLIGCSKDELKIHIQNLFLENMNFENYGEWEIDHIKPIKLCTIDNLFEIFNFKNLQPLWKNDNRIKSSKFL